MVREIDLEHITKIEGHARLSLRIEHGEVKKCELSCMEGARYFEGVVRGRNYTEVQEITSRICGICSCAHVIASTMAVEDAIGFTPSVQTKQLRVLLMLAERIRSHATHLYFLSLPDFLGFESALAMAKEYKEQLKDALQLMKAGNRSITILGARDLHPVSAEIGGWRKLPSQEDLLEMRNMLLEARPAALRTCALFSGLTFPDYHTDAECFALVEEGAYAVLDGKFVGNGKVYTAEEYRDFVREYHVPYSGANFVVAEGKEYYVGALARINHSHEWLRDAAKQQLRKSGIVFPSSNPYHNIIAQAIEIIHCIDHAIDIITTVDWHPEPLVIPPPKAGTGVGVVEVPRGTLFHEYTIDEAGVVTDANIITPTAQNLLAMQEDIRRLVPLILEKERAEIVLDIEKLIRSYDPCFSCSAHFLEVDWE